MYDKIEGTMALVLDMGATQNNYSASGWTDKEHLTTPLYLNGVVKLVEGNQPDVLHIRGAILSDPCLRTKKISKPLLADWLPVRPWYRLPIVDLHSAVHASKVPLASTVRDGKLVSELQQGSHPELLFVVLDHRGHRLVLVHKCADPATEAAASTTWGCSVYNQGTLAVR